ncbi:MAG: YIP1 family protein [Alkalilacustris sp.]
MDTSLNAVLGLARDIVADPRAAARAIILSRLPMNARWLALALVVVLSVIFGQISVALMMSPSGMMGAMLSGPGTSILLQAGVLLLMAVAMQQVGAMFGGGGNFPDAMLLVACLQGVMILIQMVQIVALMLLPPLAGIVSLVGFGVFLWVLTGFVAEMHGFRSLLSVFGMILVTAFAIAFVLAMLLAMAGIAPPQGR